MNSTRTLELAATLTTVALEFVPVPPVIIAGSVLWLTEAIPERR